ncbi:hypothetical protein PMAYCL1PPCAC_19864, partial [Pristionchus mayeri]
WLQMEMEMSSIVQKLAENKYRLNRLTSEEYEQVKEECGKIPPQNRIINGIDFDIIDHPWVVIIAMEGSFLDEATVAALLFGRASLMVASLSTESLEVSLLGRHWRITQESPLA